MINQEKAAGMLDTSEAAQQTTHAEFTPEKRLSNLRARAALDGVVLHAIEGDFGATIFIFSKWAMTRQLDSIEAAERWLAGVTGVNHG